VGAVVHAADRSNIDTVIVAGRVRKAGGRIVGLDEARLRALASSSQDHLLAAYGYRPALFCEGHVELAHPMPNLSRYWL
jgi:hypothetical protein